MSVHKGPWDGGKITAHQADSRPSDKHSLDEPREMAHAKKMNEITREELNAKLETIETKMDARVESVSSKIDAFINVQAERDKRLEATINQISNSHAEIKAGISSMKSTMIVTVVSAVIAIVIGIAGFNAMLTSNMVASFQMGRSELALQKQQESQSAPPSTPAQPMQQK
ncbi:hypothetical protein TRP66_03050 [Pseudomonas sp. JDS28PS106]|uniref:hypothetical protein n=1 Tax=Pseudomonas sp. JDS28PS106 TaxID=2497235 RepID=UPI002FD493D6